jgi:hypothetical protein
VAMGVDQHWNRSSYNKQGAKKEGVEVVRGLVIRHGGKLGIWGCGSGGTKTNGVFRIQSGDGGHRPYRGFDLEAWTWTQSLRPYRVHKFCGAPGPGAMAAAERGPTEVWSLISRS